MEPVIAVEPLKAVIAQFTQDDVLSGMAAQGIVARTAKLLDDFDPGQVDRERTEVGPLEDDPGTFVEERRVAQGRQQEHQRVVSASAIDRVGPVPIAPHEPVVTGTAAESVRSEIALDRVVATIPAVCIIAGPTPEDIRAGPARDIVVVDAALHRVVARPGVDVVIVPHCASGRGHDDVVGLGVTDHPRRTTDRQVFEIPERRAEEVRAEFQPFIDHVESDVGEPCQVRHEQVVVARATVEDVFGLVGDVGDRVVARPAVDEILFGAALQLIVAGPAVKPAVTGMAEDRVVARPAEDAVAVLTAHQAVVALSAKDRVIAGPADDRVVPIIARHLVRTVVARQVIAAVAAFDRVVVSAADDGIVTAFTGQQVRIDGARDGVGKHAAKDVFDAGQRVGLDRGALLGSVIIGFVVKVDLEGRAVRRGFEKAEVQSVIARTAIEIGSVALRGVPVQVVTGPAIDRVAAVARGDRVITGATIAEVAGPVGGDGIVPAAPEKRHATGIALDSVIAVPGLDDFGRGMGVDVIVPDRADLPLVVAIGDRNIGAGTRVEDGQPDVQPAARPDIGPDGPDKGKTPVGQADPMGHDFKPGLEFDNVPDGGARRIIALNVQLVGTGGVMDDHEATIAERDQVRVGIGDALGVEDLLDRPERGPGVIVHLEAGGAVGFPGDHEPAAGQADDAGIHVLQAVAVGRGHVGRGADGPRHSVHDPNAQGAVDARQFEDKCVIAAGQRSDIRGFAWARAAAERDFLGPERAEDIPASEPQVGFGPRRIVELVGDGKGAVRLRRDRRGPDDIAGGRGAGDG